jgi:exodeoxyribonuclease V alpha subunit
MNNILDSLSKSKFRSSFHLNKKMKEYVLEKGLDKIEEHAYDFINKRLKPAYIENDGNQTPMRQVHPVFIAQHATGTCCRNCLMKIHHIPKGRDLTDKEVRYIVNVIMIWIQRELK